MKYVCPERHAGGLMKRARELPWTETNECRERRQPERLRLRPGHGYTDALKIGRTERTRTPVPALEPPRSGFSKDRQHRAPHWSKPRSAMTTLASSLSWCFA